MTRYGTVNEEAAALEEVIADRYPTMTPEDRSMFAAAVLFKVADLYRWGARVHSDGVSVRLHSYDGAGNGVGSRSLVIEDPS